MVEWFEWEFALIESDQRKEYGEPQFRAYGVIDDRLYSALYTAVPAIFASSVCAKPIEERLMYVSKTDTAR